MKIESSKNFFQPRARLLLQLGDKLIKNENIALLELIKNSYDADARKVKVKLRHLKNKEVGYIEVLDDGEGMDMKVIENAWLEPGSDHKEILTKKNIRTKKYDRLPIGEKGIGRFGVHKLGNKIELISRQENKNEVVVIIDWDEFSKEKYLKDAKFEVYERTPEYFKRSKTGTKITISKLKNEWDKKMVRELYRSVFTLNSPFHKVGKFKVDIDLDDKKLLDKLPKWNDIKKFALWHFECKIKGHEITHFKYEFTPWDTLTGVKGRTLTLKDDEYISDRSTLVVKSKEKGKKEEILNLSKKYGDKLDYKTIGEISFEGYVFDRDKTTLDLSDIQGIGLLKQYLDDQGGIRIYRDNIRINEYGEKGNDWLNLDLRRVNVPAKRVSNNIILGVIDLKQEDSTALIEKTNREGFIENEAFNDFCAAILYVLNITENLRKSDKDLIRTKFNPTEKQEPVLHSLGKLKIIIDKKTEEPLKSEINKHLNKIEKDYNHINEVLLTSAGVGLTMGVGIHEVEKVISELKRMVEKEQVPDNILNLVIHLDEVIENYSDLFRQSEKDKQDLSKLINGAIFNIQYRLMAHDITLIKAFKNKPNKIIECSKRLLLGALMNIIDNSIYWLERKYKKLKVSENIDFHKKIYLDFFEDEKYATILIADNGFGFGIPTNQLSKPFISDKPDGMGLGLHIVNEIMKVQNGLLFFPEYGEYEIPEEFADGAVTVLKFKK